MNWKETKEKCPKALHKYNLYNWDGYENYKIDNYAPIVLKDLAKTNNRNLYDFFDENGVIVSVIYEINADGLEYYDWEIYDNNTRTYPDNEHNSRTEAETEAFNKAFEILENKLT